MLPSMHVKLFDQTPSTSFTLTRGISFPFYLLLLDKRDFPRGSRNESNSGLFLLRDAAHALPELMNASRS
jgi:hypothetical protein